MNKNLNGLYAITDEKLTPSPTIQNYVKLILMYGVKVIQYRAKKKTVLEHYPDALNIRKLCEHYGATFIIDDRVELAAMVKAHGVHIGKDDASIEDVRKEFDGLIGVSCYGNLERAKDMEQRGADYVAFGAFYPSCTKPEAPIVSKDILVQAKKELSIPICAIGGITSDNAKELVDAGADMTAVIGDLWGAKDTHQKINSYHRVFGGLERKRIERTPRGV
ncbi:MAG: thiamine phosphate synthase [Campylobacterales bacterium]|nr:thiamine phosphate synthase [Campylobacterales bacterium]